MAVADRPGLRPSSDRVRETLFNWLMPALPGARVLDLFAGTGALGLEAVSRGAREAVLVERDPVLAAALRDSVQRLAAQDQVAVVQADSPAWLSQRQGESFDIAFVDPPFEASLWQPALAALLPQMADEGWIHVESPPERLPVLPVDWMLHREGRTREVRYALYRRNAAAPGGDGS
ncbi:16S rRNA (guanine(966)-N(2))-methyltransferase RsmD [Pseudoxanthomonas kalamensis]|uniref:16S rRNA (guanine(966)-N(2))-methyltransferase RsmD n=1 Tax=Pseudoxanthomonas kalamensis TaxID=289483 RepID=UPI003CCCF723